MALGAGAFLCADIPDSTGRPPGNDIQVAAAMTRCVRALRACARRWDRVKVPECTGNRSADMPTDRVRERISGYLQALANTHGADLALVAVERVIVAQSGPADELSRERIPFIVRRVEVEADRRQTSHAEFATGDTFALSFWFDACLVLFFSAPYPVDFVRHRARLVARELVPLLSRLDDPPPSPAQVAPVPD